MRLALWPETAPTASRPAVALVGLLLVYLVIAQSASMLPRLITVDFYQYWAVSAALRLKGTALGPPYKNSAEYVGALAQYAAQPGNDRLATVSGIYTRPGFTATPFLYMLFGMLPLDFTLAVSIYHILQVLLFFTAVIALGVVYRYPPFLLFCLASLLVIASGSLSSDLRVGNLGCVQLAGLAGIVALVHHLPHARYPLVFGSVAVSGLTLLTLAKPNVAVIAAAMGLHLLLTRGVRFSAIAAIPALVAGAIAVILPCLYFGSWTIWHSWYRFVFGTNTYGLAGAPGPGNYSTTKILGAWLHIHVGTAVRLVAAALAISLIAVVVAAVRADPRARAAPVRSALDKVLGDPHLAMAIGVSATIALPPLFWYHYYVIALIPGLWLLSLSSRSRALPLLGLVSLALSQGLLNVVFIPLGWTGAVIVAAALAWVPLWAGSLLCVYGVGPPVTDQVRVGPAMEARGDRQPEAGPALRRPRRAKAATRA
jgi:hypothetical protein